MKEVTYESQELVHVITSECPVDCLKCLLSPQAYSLLSRDLQARIPLPATVGDVVVMRRFGLLTEIKGLGRRRIGEIETALIVAGYCVEPFERMLDHAHQVISGDCPIRCLKGALPQVVYDLLAIGLALRGSPDATVADVIRLSEQRGWRHMRGIGATRAREIQTCLFALGLIEPRKNNGTGKVIEP